MSMINCPECGKEISDKASSCPNCGFPLIQNDNESNQNEAIAKYASQSYNPIVEDCIGCPKCGSTELHAEKQGFSGKKALVGAVLTGGIGLLAGTIGSKNVNITCLKCGNKFKAGEGKTVKKVTFPDSFVMDEAVLQKLTEGQKYAAAVKYGEIHNVEQLDALGIVEAYIKAHPSSFKDDKPATSTDNNGCATVMVALVVVSIIAAFALI